MMSFLKKISSYIQFLVINKVFTTMINCFVSTDLFAKLASKKPKSWVPGEVWILDCNVVCAQTV